jgi:hypothetical protein
MKNIIQLPKDAYKNFNSRFGFSNKSKLLCQAYFFDGKEELTYHDIIPNFVLIFYH